MAWCKLISDSKHRTGTGRLVTVIDLAFVTPLERAAISDTDVVLSPNIRRHIRIRLHPGSKAQGSTRIGLSCNGLGFVWRARSLCCLAENSVLCTGYQTDAASNPTLVRW
jgi:hypothetical protein